MGQDALETGFSGTVKQYGGGCRPNVFGKFLEVHRSHTLAAQKQRVNVIANPVDEVTGWKTQP